MDVKDLIMQSENSLPTLDQNLSTTTTQVSALPTITASESTYWKTGGSIVLGLVGAFFLRVGFRQNDVQKLVIGVLLTVGSFFIF